MSIYLALFNAGAPAIEALKISRRVISDLVARCLAVCWLGCIASIIIIFTINNRFSGWVLAVASSSPFAMRSPRLQPRLPMQ